MRTPLDLWLATHAEPNQQHSEAHLINHTHAVPWVLQQKRPAAGSRQQTPSGVLAEWYGSLQQAASACVRDAKLLRQILRTRGARCSPDKVQAPAGVGIPQRGARKALEKVGLKYGRLQGGEHNRCGGCFGRCANSVGLKARPVVPLGTAAQLHRCEPAKLTLDSHTQVLKQPWPSSESPRHARTMISIIVTKRSVNCGCCTRCRYLRPISDGTV